MVIAERGRQREAGALREIVAARRRVQAQEKLDASGTDGTVERSAHR